VFSLSKGTKGRALKVGRTPLKSHFGQNRRCDKFNYANTQNSYEI